MGLRFVEEEREKRFFKLWVCVLLKRKKVVLKNF